MKPTSRSQSKGRGQSQAGSLKKLKTPQLKKTAKFKSKVTKKDNTGTPGCSRRNKSLKRPSSSSDPPGKVTSPAGRGRTAKANNKSPGRASHSSPVGKASGKSPARKSPGRSPTRQQSTDGAKNSPKSPKSNLTEVETSTVTENSSSKSKSSPSENLEMKRPGKAASSDGCKTAQSAKSQTTSPSDKAGKKSLSATTNKSKRISDQNTKSSEETDDIEKDKKKGKKYNKDLDTEKDEVEKVGKKKKKPDAKEDLETKKGKKIEDNKDDDDIEETKKKKIKSAKEEVDSDTDGKKDGGSEVITNKETKKGKKIEDSPTSAKKKSKKIEQENDKEQKKGKKSTEGKEDVDKIGKKKSPKKIKEVKKEIEDDEEETDSDDDLDSPSGPKQSNLSSPKEKLEKSSPKAETKEENENTSGSSPKQKKGTAKKGIGGNAIESPVKSSPKDESSKDTVGKGSGSIKKEISGDKKATKEKDAKQQTALNIPDGSMPKKRGRPKGSKNKKKNEGFTAKAKKDKTKTEKKVQVKQTDAKNKKERSVFSFSESDGEKDEKYLSNNKKKLFKSPNNMKTSKFTVENGTNSSSENQSSDEETKDTKKAKLTSKKTKSGLERAKPGPKKKIIGSKASKFKKGADKSKNSLCKKVLKQVHKRGTKKSSQDHSGSSDIDEKMPSNKLASRSDDSFSSDSDLLKAIQKSLEQKKLDQKKGETSEEEGSDEDGVWQSLKSSKKLNPPKRGRPGPKPKKKPQKKKVVYKTDDEEEGNDEDEDEDDLDYKNYRDTKVKKGKKINKKSTGGSQSTKKAKTINKPSLKSVSSSEVEDECDTVEKKPRKKIFKAQKSSPKDDLKKVKKSKKVSWGKKTLGGQVDSSVDESGKESDSEYETSGRKKKTMKNTIKSNKTPKKKREVVIPPVQRTMRMASLNAMAMMHCMNEDARTPLPVLPAPTPKPETSMALVLRKPLPSDDDSDERDFDTDDDTSKKSKMNKRKNEEVEKKVKQKRKKRRGELDVHMDMRDMVVTKRMASLNASAIMAASYSSESRKRTPAAGTSSSAESEITNVDIKRKISVKSTKDRRNTTRSVITVEETTKKVKKAQGNHETQMEEHIIVKKKVRKSGTTTTTTTDSDKEDGTGTDDSQLDPDIMPKSPKDSVESVVEANLDDIIHETPPAPMTVTISGESTYCISKSDGKTTTVVKQVQRKSTTTVCPTSSVPPTACIPPTHHVQPQPHNSYPASPQKPPNYTPLGALSTMQPVMSSGSHHHHHHHYQHPQSPHHPPPHPHHHQPPHHLQHPHHHQPPHHQPHHHQPPPHHQPPQHQPHHQSMPHHHPQPPHHQPPNHHPHHPPPPHHHGHPSSHPHHHQQYPPPPPPSSQPHPHPHGATPPHGHHYGYRPPSQPPAGHPNQGNPPPPTSSHSHPGHASPGYISPNQASVMPNHPVPPHHSPKQITPPNIVSPGLKSPTPGSMNPGTPTNVHPPSGSPRCSAPPSNQVERHHSAFTAPTPSIHSPAASTPAGYQPVSGPMPVKANYTATTSSDASSIPPYKTPPKGSPVAAAPPYSSPPRLTSPPPPAPPPGKGNPYQTGGESYPPSYQYQTYSYHPGQPAPPPPPPPPPHIAPYGDKYYPRGATYLYPPSYSGGQYGPPGAEYSYPPPPPGSVHYSQESYTYTLCVPNSPPQGPPQALALPPPPPPTSNAPHPPPAYATYHYMDYTPVFTYPPPGTIVKINFIGPSSQSTICCPVDPKNVHTGPPTGSGRGSETSTNNMSHCSGPNQDQGGSASQSTVGPNQSGGRNCHYQYTTTQQQPPHQSQSGTLQGCGASSGYQTGPVTTVMTTGTQPTVQMYGGAVPQQALTHVPSQDTQAANAPPSSSAPPPVPAPVPPNVPLSQPHSATQTSSTTMVAVAPVNVTVAISPGVQVGATPQSVASSHQQHQSTTAVAAVSESVCVSEVPQNTTVATSHTTKAFPVAKGGSQENIVSAQVSAPGRLQTSTVPTHITSTVMSGRYSVTAPTQVSSMMLPGRPQQAVAPTQVTTAIVTGIPHTTIASPQVPTSSVTVNRASLRTPTEANSFSSSISQSSAASHKVSNVMSVNSSVQSSETSTNIPLVVNNSQSTTAVVTGVPKVNSSMPSSSEVKRASQLGTLPKEKPQQFQQTGTSISSATKMYASQPGQMGFEGLNHKKSSIGNINTTHSAVPKLTGTFVPESMTAVSGMPKTSTQVATAVVSGIPKASAKICTPAQNCVPKQPAFSTQSGGSGNRVASELQNSSLSVSRESISSLTTKITTAVVSDVPKPTKASTQANTAVVSCLPKSPKPCTQIATAIVSGVPKQPQDAIVPPTTVVSVVTPSFKSSHVTSVGTSSHSSPLKSSPQTTTAVVCGVPKSVSVKEKMCSTSATSLPKSSRLAQTPTTAMISGVQQKTTLSAFPSNSSIDIKSPFSSGSAITTGGLNKLSSSQANTAIVSGVPRASVAPTPITKMKPSVSKGHGENTRTRSDIVGSGIANTSGSLAKSQVSLYKDKTKSIPNTAPLLNSSTLEKKTEEVSSVLSVVSESQTVNKAGQVKEVVKNMCSVSPMNASGEGIKVLGVVKKDNSVNIPSKILDTSKSIGSTRLPITDLKIPEPVSSWSPRGKEGSGKSNLIRSSDINVQTKTATSEPVYRTKGLTMKTTSQVTASSLSVNVPQKSRNHNSLTGTAISVTSVLPAGSSAKSVSRESERSLGCKQNRTKEADISVTSDSNHPGYQRPSTRHLLCQSLPTPTLTKTATAPLAKAKSHVSTNLQRMFVKSEDKSKDVKPNIPENVPNNVSNRNPCDYSSDIIPLKVPTKKELESETEDVKINIVESVPVSRKRGRPPKTRDSSSDSNTASDSSLYSSPKNKVKPKLSATAERKPFAKQEIDIKKSKISVPTYKTKSLRYQSEDKKKLKLQYPKPSTSPSKQIDCKEDIKLKSMIKTEVMPKIKEEKVSPKGITKHSPPLKDVGKEMFFKAKFFNKAEIPLQSPLLSKKCEMPLPSKTLGFSNMKMKGSKELKKSPNSQTDQRQSKNSVVTSKSKTKEADRKFFTSNYLKRKSSDTFGTDVGKGSAWATKANPSETFLKSSTGAKQLISKSPKKEKKLKGSSHKSPNGKLNRKSLLSYLKEKNNESDTSSVDSEAASGNRKRSKSKEDSPKANSASPFPPFPPQPITLGSRRRSSTTQGKGKTCKKPKWVHNWSWEGDSFEGKIWLRNDELPLARTCYTAIRHKEGDVVRVRDCVLLRSGPRKTDLPFVAKIASLWEDPETSDMRMSILWYYRPEHTESGRRPEDLPDEIFASKHRDHLSVACIEDRCFVLTFNEYCRYRRFLRLFQEGVCPVTTPVPGPEEGYCRKDRQPPGCVVPELLFFCRKVYDYRQKRILKNPY